jgi:hypothetical protein
MANVSVFCTLWRRAVLFGDCAEGILWAIVLLGEIIKLNSLMQTHDPRAYEKKDNTKPTSPRHSHGLMNVGRKGQR